MPEGKPFCSSFWGQGKFRLNIFRLPPQAKYWSFSLKNRTQRAFIACVDAPCLPIWQVYIWQQRIVCLLWHSSGRWKEERIVTFLLTGTICVPGWKLQNCFVVNRHQFRYTVRPKLTEFSVNQINCPDCWPNCSDPDYRMVYS